MTDKTWKPCGPCPTNCDYVLDVSSLPLTRPQSLAEVFISTYLSVLVKTIFLTYFLQNYWGAEAPQPPCSAVPVVASFLLESNSSTIILTTPTSSNNNTKKPRDREEKVAIKVLLVNSNKEHVLWSVTCTSQLYASNLHSFSWIFFCSQTLQLLKKLLC